jgi:hypothetical protein
VIAGPYALLDESGREPVGATVQLAVRDRRALVFGGDGARCGGGLPFDGVVDEGVGDGDFRALAELPEQGPVLEGQMAQGHASQTSWLWGEDASGD